MKNRKRFLYNEGNYYLVNLGDGDSYGKGLDELGFTIYPGKISEENHVRIPVQYE